MSGKSSISLVDILNKIDSNIRETFAMIIGSLLFVDFAFIFFPESDISLKIYYELWKVIVVMNFIQIGFRLYTTSKSFKIISYYLDEFPIVISELNDCIIKWLMCDEESNVKFKFNKCDFDTIITLNGDNLNTYKFQVSGYWPYNENSTYVKIKLVDGGIVDNFLYGGGYIKLPLSIYKLNDFTVDQSLNQEKFLTSIINGYFRNICMEKSKKNGFIVEFLRKIKLVKMDPKWVFTELANQLNKKDDNQTKP